MCTDFELQHQIRRLFDMARGLLLLTIATLTSVYMSAAPVSDQPEGIAFPEKKLRPFLDTYCIRCHGPDKQKGQVRFDMAAWNVRTVDEAQRWQDALDQLNGGDMPPEDEKQPTNNELSEALDSLTGALLQARKRFTDHGGEIKMRRLNRREYSLTIRDLFGFEVALVDIPEDGEIATFDTVGAEQYFSSAHFEKYYELGKKIALESFRFNLSAKRPVKSQRTQVENQVTKKMRENLVDLDRKMSLKKKGATWKEMGFRDEGEMEVIFRQWDARAELPRSYLQYPLVDKGVYITDVAKWVSANMHTDIRGEYVVRIHGGIVGEPNELRKIVRVRGRQRTLGTIKLSGTPENPQTVEMRTRQLMGRSMLSIQIRENMPDNTINSMHGYINKLQGPAKRANPRAAVWIDWIEIEGPYYGKTRSKWEDILFPGMPTGGKSPYIWDDSKIKELIEKFAFEAFRRQSPEPEYITGLHEIFKQNRAEGMSHRDAMIDVLGIILASPGFLFLHEAEPAITENEESLSQNKSNIQKEPLDGGDKSIGGLADYSEELQSRIREDLDLQLARSLLVLKMKEAEMAKTVEEISRSKVTNALPNPNASKAHKTKELNSHELAIRLSYFLWSSPPDEELYKVDLDDPQIFLKQVDRMLKDPKAQALGDGFISQWAEFDRYDAVTIDNTKHYYFNEGVQQDAKKEVKEFFSLVVKENLPSANLVDSNFVTVNGALAAHYGLDFPETNTDKFLKVSLPDDSPRGGLITQTAFLVTGSNGERSSPVIRGALIMEKLLHDAPAPPPPNVPELGAASDSPKTNRQMVELHQQKAVCASCHKKMDIVGFGLENFDTTGRWRNEENVGRKSVPIQPGGTLPDGSTFTNVIELKKVLLTYEDKLAKELLESLLAYALGRTIEFSDADDVESLLTKLKPDRYRVGSMIREIALSPLFRTK